MTPQHEEALRALRLADRDIAVFERIKDVPEIHLSMMCFHAQQAVEKSLKAVLYEKHVDFRRTHDLAELAALLQHRLPRTIRGCGATEAESLWRHVPLRRPGPSHASSSTLPTCARVNFYVQAAGR